ncbi:MAG: TIGR02757 family protein [Candidatus Rifleibacteriota bacterium]
MKTKHRKIDLKPLLDKVLSDFPPASRKNADPIQFPRWYFEHGRHFVEVEAVALISAMLAYGSAKQFIKKLHELMEACDWQYLDLITGKQKKQMVWPAYRLSTAEEIATLCMASGALIKKHGSIKQVFLNGYKPDNSIKAGLTELQQTLLEECTLYAGTPTRGLKHLLPDPSAGGCAKRWHMFLRWLVRKDDGVDMHIWPEVSPSKLLIPLDRHISRISRNLGLTSRKVDDWKTAEEISASLAKFDAEDPIKYDFSLCHLGIAGQCTHGKNPELCKNCILKPACMALHTKS